MIANSNSFYCIQENSCKNPSDLSQLHFSYLNVSRFIESQLTKFDRNISLMAMKWISFYECRISFSDSSVENFCDNNTAFSESKTCFQLIYSVTSESYQHGTIRRSTWKVNICTRLVT